MSERTDLLESMSGTDIVLTESRMESARNFANKIWNAARFLFGNMEKSGVEPWAPDPRSPYRPEADASTLEVPLEDRWIFSAGSVVWCDERVAGGRPRARGRRASQRGPRSWRRVFRGQARGRG